MPNYKYTPEHFGNAMSVNRVGGIAYGNFTATGETLFMKDLSRYIKAFVEQGHYAEIVTNLTYTKVINEILSWDKKLLNRIEFKCSFHYLELKKKSLLKTFADNVHNIKSAGASVNIEMVPADDVIPYIKEIKEFCMENFYALPHLTIARNDRTKGIDYLTNLTMEEYDKTWSQFDSDFWKFKKSIFGIKQVGFCYAGAWSYYVNLMTGEARQCYCGDDLGDIFANPEEELPYNPIGKCQLPHCFNGHMLLSAGLIPEVSDVRYGDIRNRSTKTGDWLNNELLSCFNERLSETNQRYGRKKENLILLKKALKTNLIKGRRKIANITLRQIENKQCIRKS